MDGTSDRSLARFVALRLFLSQDLIISINGVIVSTRGERLFADQPACQPAQNKLNKLNSERERRRERERGRGRERALLLIM